MEKLSLLYEGKAKRVFKTENPERYVVEFKDDATAFNGQKKGSIGGKGVINNKVSSFLFQLLAAAGIENHFIQQLGERDMLVRSVEIIPIEVVVRNIAAGSLCRRTGLAEGTVLSEPVMELYYKDDALGDPLFNLSHIKALGIATLDEVAKMTSVSLKVNEILRDYFSSQGIDLIDYKLEFGRAGDCVLLADEISPDTCRFWDKETKKKLDKDRFRFDLGDVESGYQELLERVVHE